MALSFGTLMAFMAGLLTPLFWAFTYRAAVNGRTSDFITSIILILVITLATYESPIRNPGFFLGIGVGVVLIWWIPGRWR